MGPSLSTELTAPALARDAQRQLLAIARATVADSAFANQDIDLAALPAALGSKRAVFVTLTLDGRLRGCIGSLIATEPLAHAVAAAAQGAAHRDPRFPPLRVEELAGIRIEISVLSDLEPIAVGSRQALLHTLRPGVDGLLLEQGRHRATFLPSVWRELPSADEFVSQLLAKAGLPPDHWSAALRLHRYVVSRFADGDDPGSR